MSRLIDVNPNIAIKSRLTATQKKVSRGLVLSELITDAEGTKPREEGDEPVAMSWDKTAEMLTELATDQIQAEPE